MAMHTELAIYKAAMGLLQMAMNLTRNIPRELKQQLSKRVIDECIDVLMLIIRANSTRDKRPYLTELVEKVQVIEMLMRLFKESRFISVPQHAKTRVFGKGC
ncbi:four helix bundle protein [Pseudomonas gregormendelii]|uniref:Four helix bundle protein n=1 Tax=Pseudomonas gregormendelii TaxID=1628277 RepID=A0ABS3AEJ2_9PSED|nr:four helix bundle protein [Pseudomonas gregormendelii]MBN3965588.1 four helix bundle protein [Pseudomonas gregormendelii]